MRNMAKPRSRRKPSTTSVRSLPPTASEASRRRKSTPDSASFFAAHRPARPPPMMTTSASVLSPASDAEDAALGAVVVPRSAGALPKRARARSRASSAAHAISARSDQMRLPLTSPSLMSATVAARATGAVLASPRLLTRANLLMLPAVPPPGDRRAADGRARPMDAGAAKEVIARVDVMSSELFDASTPPDALECDGAERKGTKSYGYPFRVTRNSS